ncbi:MAG: hypothetical protein H0Z39_10835 [Peptococcaceae bacterium]|nr:hypothetical protein [Peptococcaceae bacterium]
MKLPFWKQNNNNTAWADAIKNIRIITVWSPLSTGKSFIARALTWSLSKDVSKVCLADFDMLTPGISLTDGGSLNDIADMVFRGDFTPEVVQSIPSIKENKRIHFLGGLTDLLLMDLLTPQVMRDLVQALADTYLTVIDTGRELNLSATLAALDHADLVVVPVVKQWHCVRHTRRYLTFLQNEMRMDISRMRLIVNEGYPGDLSVEEMEEILQFPIEGTLKRFPDLNGNTFPKSVVGLVKTVLGNSKNNQMKGGRLFDGNGKLAPGNIPAATAK